MTVAATTSRVSIWSPAIGALLCQALGVGLIGIFGFFVEPVAEEFDIGVAQINMAPVLLLLVPGVIGPFIGKLIDRVVIRHLLLAGIAVAMMSLYAVSLASTPTLAVFAFLGFALGISMYGPIAVNALLVKIYQQQLGRALAIAAMGVSIGTAVLPFMVALILEHSGWRETLQWLAVAVFVLLSFAVWRLMPALAGAKEQASDDGPAVETSYLKDRACWQIGLAVALSFNCALVVGICYAPHFSVLGFTLPQAAFLVSLSGVFGLLGKVVVAALVDRILWPARWVAALFLFGQLLGIVLTVLADSYWPMALGVAVTGLGTGAFIPMHPYLNSAYFSQSLIGRVTGVQMPLFLPFGLVGAPLAGYSFDVSGSYAPVFAALCIAMLVAVALVIMLPRAGSEH